MTTPTPAAVRAALKNGVGPLSVDESREYRADPRPPDYLLRDHIRAIAAEMRAESIAMQVNTHDPFVEPGTREAEITAAKRLAVFADKLEGKQS